MRIAGLVLLVLMLGGSSAALPNHYALTDSQGLTHHFWLAKNGSAETSSWALNYFNNQLMSPQVIFTFSQEAVSYDLAINNGVFYLFYAIKKSSTEANQLYGTSSVDYGRNFTQPQSLNQTGRNPCLAFDQFQPYLAYQVNDKIKLLAGQNGSTALADYQTLALTNEALSWPKIALDQQHNLHLVCLAKNKFSGAEQVIYTRWPTVETKVIFQSFANLKNLALYTWENSLVAVWQQAYSSRLGTYVAVSLDQGVTFGEPKLIDLDQDLIALNFTAGQIAAWALNQNQPEQKLLNVPAPAAPQIIFPASGDVVNGVRLKIRYLVADSDPVSATLSLRPISQTTEYLYTQVSSRSAQGWSDFSPTTDLPEGAYQAQIKLFNGLTSSQWSRLVTFKIDPLAAADPDAPVIKVLKPEKNSWFKAASVIALSASVIDARDDISSEAEAQVLLDHVLLTDTLTYNQAERALVGLIGLPARLAEGPHAGQIIFADETGRQGTAAFSFSLDNTPPAAASQVVYTNSSYTAVLPLSDTGSGLDTTGTIVRINCLSTESSVTSITTDPAGQLLITTSRPLRATSTEVNVQPRDLVGNSGQPVTFSVILDTVPPRLELETSEAVTDRNKIIISGSVQETNPATIVIYNNAHKVDDFPLLQEQFSREVLLFSGQNNLIVEVSDAAGNQTATALNITSNYVPAQSIILNCQNGPNPFSPQHDLTGALGATGTGMVFSYALAQPADLCIRIYDLTGQLIWIKNIKNTASGVTAWGGENQLGGLAGSGLYPYFLSATAAGQTETHRGKILIIN